MFWGGGCAHCPTGQRSLTIGGGPERPRLVQPPLMTPRQLYFPRPRRFRSPPPAAVRSHLARQARSAAALWFEGSFSQCTAPPGSAASKPRNSAQELSRRPPASPFGPTCRAGPSWPPPESTHPSPPARTCWLLRVLGEIDEVRLQASFGPSAALLPKLRGFGASTCLATSLRNARETPADTFQ